MKTPTWIPLACFALLILTTAPNSGAAADAPVTVELNKLEEQGGGCRVHLVIRNTTAAAYDSYKLDLVLFGGDGIIARRIAVEIAPLRANKKSVKLFDVADLVCPAIGSILVNDVLECSGPGAAAASCIDGLQLSSRAGIELSK
jgi:hypothetical protein